MFNSHGMWLTFPATGIAGIVFPLNTHAQQLFHEETCLETWAFLSGTRRHTQCEAMYRHSQFRIFPTCIPATKGILWLRYDFRS